MRLIISQIRKPCVFIAFFLIIMQMTGISIAEDSNDYPFIFIGIENDDCLKEATINDFVSENQAVARFCLSGIKSDDYYSNGVIGYTIVPITELTERQNFDFIGQSKKTHERVKVFFPEGTPVFLQDESSIHHPDSDYKAIMISELASILIYVPSESIVPIEQYTGYYSPPVLTIDYREAMFSSLYAHDHSIRDVVNPGDQVEIIAAFDHELFVRRDNDCGFIRQDGVIMSKDVYFNSKNNKVIYDRELRHYDMYYEPFYEAVDFMVSQEDAIRIAKETIKPLLVQMKYQQIGIDDCSTSVRVNASHAHTRLGVTWQVIYYGKRDTEDQSPQQYFVTFNDSENTLLVLPNSYCSYADTVPKMDKEDWARTRSFLGDDIENRYVYYVVEVSVETGESVLLSGFKETPIGRLGVFYRKLESEKQVTLGTQSIRIGSSTNLDHGSNRFYDK